MSSVGSVSVDVVPSAVGWAEKLRAQIRDYTAHVKVEADTDEAEAQLEGAARTRTAKVRVDTTEAKTKLTELQSLLRKKTLDLGVSTSAAQAQIVTLQSELANLKAGNLDLDDTAAKARIAEIQAQIKTLRGQLALDSAPAREEIARLKAEVASQKVVIQAEADTAAAETQLDEVARDRTSRIKVDVDKSRLSEGASALDSFIGKLGLLPALAVTAGSALIPLVGVAGGLAAALAAPLAIAGGGATLFAFLGGLAAKDTEAKLKNIDQLRTKLHGLTKGTAEYAAAQKQLHDAEKALTPQQRQFAAAQDGLAGAFQRFLSGKAGSALLGVMAQGMTVLAHILPVVAPLIVSVGGALGKLLTQVDHAAQSQGFARFVDQFARLAGRDIRIGGHILGELAKGVGSLILATDKGFSGSFLHGLDHLSTSFADWASSRSARHDMREFFGYVHDVGPQVAHTIGALARALGKVVDALAPLGPVVLKGVQLAADSLAAIPVPVLTALAGAFVGLAGFQKLGGLKLLGAIADRGLAGGGVKGTVGNFLTGGIQKVFVVNMEPGFGGGAGAASEGGWLSRALKSPLGTAGSALEGAGLSVGAASAYAAGGVAFGLGAAKTYADHHFNVLLNGPGGLNTLTHALGGHDLIPGQGPTGFFSSYNPFASHDTPPAPLAPSVHLQSTTSAFDALRARAQQASRQIDMIGPHADAAFGIASHDVDAFRSRLASIHDLHFQVIAETQNAVRSLEALQRMRIADKNFTVYQHYQAIERGVGPGGGMGQMPHASGVQSGSGGGGAAIHVTVKGHIDEKGYVSATAQDVYDRNRQFEAQHG